MKFPLRIEKEDDITEDLLDDLLLVHVCNLVKTRGKFIKAEYECNGEIFLTLHDGKIATGSMASLDFKKRKIYKKVAGE